MGYALPHYDDRDEFDEPPGGYWHWTAQDYTLAYALGLDDNHQAEAVVRAAVAARHPEVAARITYDSESGCFFAYTDTRDDMDVLVAVVADLVDAVHPDAVPGTIWDSPAMIRRWDPPPAATP